MDIAEIRKKAKKARKSKEKTPPKSVESVHEVPAGEKEEISGGVSTPAQPGKDATPLDTEKASIESPHELIIPTEKVYRESLETEKALEEESQRILAFSLDKEEYALEVGVIREIIKPRELTDVPNAPSFVPGIISLRGEVIPVTDLRKRLGLQAKDIDRKNRIIVTTEEDKKVGLIVDSVTKVLKILEREIEPPPPFQEGIDVEFIKGICHSRGRFIILLNLAKVLEW